MVYFMLRNMLQYMIVSILVIVSILFGYLVSSICVCIIVNILGPHAITNVSIDRLITGTILFQSIYTFLNLYYIVNIDKIFSVEKKDQLKHSPDRLPYISVIIPAYNEEDFIGKTIESVLNSCYPRSKLEVIVIDDGSTDNTYLEALRYPVKIIRHSRNMGRAEAIKTGIKYASNDIVVTIDADTVIHKYALRYLVLAFTDKAVGAVCGRLVVSRNGSILTCGQYVEYALGYAYTKTLRSHTGWMLIPSGAFSAYRKHLIEDTSISDTVAEDFDLGLHVIRKGYRLRYVREAIAYTDIPCRLSDYMRQRIRWCVGGLQVLAKHHDLFLRRKYGIVGLFGLPFHFIIGYAVLVMEFFGLSFLATLAILNPLVNYFGSYTTLLALVLWLVLLKLISIVLILPGVHYARNVDGERIGLLSILCYWLIYYYILLYAHVKGIIVYLKRGVTGW